MKIGIEGIREAHKGAKPKAKFPTTRSSPRTLGNTARLGQMSGLTNPTKLLSNAMGDTNIANLVVNVNANVRNISPPTVREREMSASETKTTGLDQKVLLKQLEHYSTLIVNLLKEVDEAQYDITLKSRSRVKGGIAGLRDMEMQELEKIWGRAAVQRAEQSFDPLGEVLGELPRMSRFMAKDPFKTLSRSGVMHVEGEIRHHSRAKRKIAVTSPQFTPDSPVGHFNRPLSIQKGIAPREYNSENLSDSEPIDRMSELDFVDLHTPASQHSGPNWAEDDMEDKEEEEEEEEEKLIVGSSPNSRSFVRKNVKGLALGAPPTQSIDAAAAGTGASPAALRSRDRESRDRGSRDRDRDREGRRKHRRDISRGKERSRSESNHRVKNLVGLGLGGAAVAAAVGYTNRNAKKNEVSDRRSRSRTRRNSIGALPAPEEADDDGNDQIAQAGPDGAAVAGLIERARSKSCGGGKSVRSKSRLRQGLPIATTGLGSAAVAGLYEKQQAGKKEEEARRQEYAARQSSRSSPSKGQKPLQPRQEKDYFTDPRSAPPTPKTSSFGSIEIGPLARPRSGSDAAAAAIGTRPSASVPKGADFLITAQHAYAERHRPLRTRSPRRRATEDRYAIQSRARVSIEAPRPTSILVPASGVFPTSSARSTRAIIINTVESPSSPVTSTRRYHRDDNYEILPNSSSTRRHHQRYSSLGTMPAAEDPRDKVHLLSGPSIRERQDENGRDNAEFRRRTHGSRGYISAPVADYQEGQLPELENVVGPQNSSSRVSPAPQSEKVEDSESSVSASFRHKRMPPQPPRREPSRSRETVAVEEAIMRAAPRSAPIEDEVVEVIEEPDPQSRRLKKPSDFGHGESVSGSSMGADMELVDRLVLLWTTVEPQ